MEQFKAELNTTFHTHCYGTAADIVVKGQKPAAVAAYARKIMPDWGGVGIYGSFTHIDIREQKADWQG